jgi:hypothetical protein
LLRWARAAKVGSWFTVVTLGDMDKDARFFLYNPEGKVGELRTGRRLHLDVMPTDRTRDEEVERLKGVGAIEHEDHRKPDGQNPNRIHGVQGPAVTVLAVRRRAV